MKKLRAGIIGVGFIGAVHIEQLRRLGNVEAAALTDALDPKGKAEAFSVPAAYTDYKEMIDRETLDSIHICTPNSTHFEIAMYALEKGVNVICEKPMTCTVEEAKQLTAKAKEKGLVNAINFNCRFYPLVYQIREMVRAGELGNIYTIHGSYLQDWLYLDTDYSWRLEPHLSGASRAFSDIGSHWLDLVEFVTGLKAVEVLADFAVFHKTRRKPLKPVDTYSGMALRPEDYEEVPINTEDYATVLFHFDNGAHGCCNISQVFAGRKNQIVAAIGGSKCAVHWDSENSNALWVGRRETMNGEIVKDPSILKPGTAQITSYPGGHVEGFPDTFKQNFKKIYAAIACGKPVCGEYATFDDGLREMIFCEKVVQSAKENRWVKI
ncbi:MAG: Gfo/Idh/MocA family oxidoreductase [Spirochaetaceae bacterium]|jgi:predicted dehydrogenase|nr:Gfo/Idh/MocA family oxidoreductase [Spirochaetaceae bacterium]